MSDEVTNWLNGESSEKEELARRLYQELKVVAKAKMSAELRERTLSSTALVNEAWIRINPEDGENNWRDRSQFFSAASEAMRRILVEAARRRSAAKRGGGMPDLPSDEVEISVPLPDERILEVHEILGRLEESDPKSAKIVKLRFFCGLNNEEIAALLDVNEKTIRRRWHVAKVWLYRQLIKTEN